MRGSTSSPKALCSSPKVDPYRVGGGGDTERSEERGQFPEPQDGGVVRVKQTFEFSK